MYNRLSLSGAALHAVAPVVCAVFYSLSLLLVVGCGSKPTVEKPDDIESSAPEQKHRFARLPTELPRKEKPRKPADSDWFEDVTADSGIDFSYQTGFESRFYQLLESVGGGVSLVDFDQDGDLDIFATGGGALPGPPIKVQGASSAMYRNDGDWRFVDVTKALNLDDDSLYSHGCSVADYDRDGWPDLLVAGFGGVRLLRNQKGRSFKDVTTSVGLSNCNSWNVQGAWADFNGDGWLDLYLMTYADWQPSSRRSCKNDRGLRDVCGPTLYEGASDQLFFSDGQSAFKDVTTEASLIDRNRGLGVVIADFNDDGRPDIFVANDVQENLLYLTGEKPPFKSQGVLAGVAYSAKGEREGSMGVATGDYDGDGRLDLFYTNYSNQDNALRHFVAPASTVPAAEKSGMGGVSRKWVGFGTVLADFDHDARPEIFITNGHVAYDRRDSPYHQPPQLFKNVNGESYKEVSELAGPYFDNAYSGRGVAAGDLDNDGAIDLVVTHQQHRLTLLRNRHKADSWIRLKLRGVTSNTEAIGAKVTIQRADRPLTYWVTGGGSYLSTSDTRILVPLLGDTPVIATVVWPNGKQEIFAELSPKSTHEIVEGMGNRP